MTVRLDHPAIAVEYDAARDELVIEGARYSAELFRRLGSIPVDQWIKIVRRAEDGVLTVFSAPRGARIAWEESR